ncbi:MAG TPA: hypothetical protein VMT88_04855 [Actinomycetes bacterium]|nr:hypothetical protein [Actinomycetes bacterium]
MSSGAGLLYAAIVILWAAVLIPMWLRGHDSTVENRSAERFGQAMRILARRSDNQDGAQDEDELPEDQQTQPATYIDAYGDEVPLTGQDRQVPRSRDQADPAQPTPTRPRRSAIAAGTARRVLQASRDRQSRPRPSLAHRRARTLFVLLGAALLLTLTAVVGVFAWWAPLPVIALLVAFVVHLRGQAKRNEALRARRSRPAAANPEASAGATITEETAVSAEPEKRRHSSRATFVPGPSRAMVVETKGSTAEADDEAWQPNPLPVPTYVTAPKAVRPIKVIDLTTPGAWTSGRLIDDDAMAEEDVLAADVAADELDALLEHEAKGRDSGDDASRRAVGD